jgi:autotransporter-associated beta strand protein
VRKRGSIVASKGLRARTLGVALLAFGAALAASPAPALAQWLEAGPFTSTSTVSPTSGGFANSNTLVYGMAAQGNPVYGAANAVLQSPVDPNTYWVATVSGGIWKTGDGGATWTPTTDHQSTLQIGAITVDTADPSGKTLYAASGDYSAGLYLHYAAPATILKSTDGGNSWQTVSVAPCVISGGSATGICSYSLSSSGVQSVDPTQSTIKNIIAMGNVILIAAGGSQGTGLTFYSGGLYRSTDGGVTFSLVPNFNTEVSNLISTTVNNQTVLIAARNGGQDHAQTGILYSTDAGATWTPILGPGSGASLLPTTASNPTNNPDGLVFNSADNNLNIKVATGPGGELFVATVKFQTPTYQPTNLVYTPNFTPGTTPTWYNLGEVKFQTPGTNCTTDPRDCTLEGNRQGYLHFALVADPLQQGVAYIAGSGVFGVANDEVASIVRVNFNAATTDAVFTPIVLPNLNSAPHPDTRSLVFNSAGSLLTTDDGGVYSLTNPSSNSGTWTALGGVAAGGSPIRSIEAFSAVMDPKTGRLAVATQDNGASLSAPNAALTQIKPGSAWQNTLGGDGFSVAVNSRTSGPSIFYATSDDIYLARTFANQNLSPSSPVNLLEMDVGAQNYLAYENGFAGGAVVTVNAVDSTKLLFRSARLYTWTDPGTALSGSIQLTDISNGTNLFGNSTGNVYNTAWAEKIAYGTQDAPDAILAGGPIPGGNTGVYLLTQEEFNAGNKTIGPGKLLSSFANANSGNPGDPVGVLFDPLTEHKFFIADTLNVYATNDTGNTLRTLTLPTTFGNPASLAYIADNTTGNAINGVRALVVGGLNNVASSQGGIISTLDPFATNVQWTNLGPSLPNAVVSDLNYYSDIDTLVAALYGRGVYVLYDVTSHYASATELWFGKANNDSAPDVSLLTGNRPLEKFGTGTLTLTGNATYTGGTIIDAGVVAITADANLGAPQGGITFNGGVLQTNAQLTSARNVTLASDGAFDAEADTILSGVISGPGALDKIGPATLTLTGNNSYLGGTFIFGGTLAIGFDGALGDPSGQIGIDAGTLRATSSFSTARTVAFGVDGGGVNVDSGATLSANGLWVAQGPVTKTGSGVLALEDVGFFQTLTVGAGTLQVDGSINGTSLRVMQGATLSGIGQIAAPTTVAGTLMPGDAPGILTFTAPLVLSSSATLRIAIDGTATGGGAGTYAQIIVNGASLTVGGTLQPFFRGINGGNNGFTPVLGQQFLIASASGGVSGQFSGVDLTGSGLPSTLRMDTLFGPTYVDLITTPASYSAAPAGSVWNANQQSVGAALDALRPAAGTISSNTTLQNAFNALYKLPPSELGPVLTGLSAEDEARGVGHALDAVDVFHVALQEHLIGGQVAPGFNNLSFSVSGAGRNFYSAYNSMGAPAAGTSMSRDASAPTAISSEHWWSSVFYQNNMTGSSAGISGGSANISGFIAGLEGEVKPGQLVGAVASYSHTDASGNGSGSGDNFVLAAYGRRTAGPLQAALYGGVAISSIGLHHDFGTGTITSQSGGATSLLGGGSLAYTFDYRGFQITPTATAAFTHMLFDGTTVNSPMGFALDVPRQWTDRFRFTLGPTIARTVTTERGTKWTATVSAGFLYQTAPVTALDAQIFTAPTLALTAPAGGAGAYADAGVYASLTNWLTGFVRWHGEAREHANSNQVSGGLSVTF